MLVRSAAVLLALALLVPRPAAAGDLKLDLTGYLAPDSEPGDYRVFSDGAGLTRRLELVLEEVGPKGRIEVVETLVDGEPTGATGAVVQPGRRAKLVSIVAANLAIRLRRGLAIPFRIRPGVWIRTGAAGSGFVGDIRVAKVRIRREWRLVGFESIDIPGASALEAAEVEDRTVLVVKERRAVGGRRIEIHITSTGFLVEGWGNVVVEENTETWIDGVLSEQTGPTRWTLVEGTLFGQPIP